eukprot:301760-Hanusia_phi.AAC.3
MMTWQDRGGRRKEVVMVPATSQEQEEEFHLLVSRSESVFTGSVDGGLFIKSGEEHQEHRMSDVRTTNTAYKPHMRNAVSTMQARTTQRTYTTNGPTTCFI